MDNEQYKNWIKLGEDEESVIFHRKLLHKDHVKNEKTCKLCKHCEEQKLDRDSTHCSI